MDIKGYRHIPRTLFDTITFLAQALPKRSVPTFLELLFGAMLTQTGFVTDAVLAVDSLRHWTSYYKWLQCGKWSWVDLGRQTARLSLRTFRRRRWFLMLDDTVVFKSSKKAPGSPPSKAWEKGQSPNLCQRVVLGDIGTDALKGVQVAWYPDSFPSGSPGRERIGQTGGSKDPVARHCPCVCRASDLPADGQLVYALYPDHLCPGVWPAGDRPSAPGHCTFSQS